MKTFVEIGSSGFDTLRHLCDQGWKGIMVDPIEIALDQVPEHDNLIKVYGAIDKDFSIRTLTKIKDKYWNDNDFDRDYLGMASLSPESAVHDLIPEILENVEVACTTFEFLMNQLNINTIDYLKIDAEGLDYDILSSIDFNKFDIKVIRAEHEHLDPILFVDLLSKNNYFVDVLRYDIIAIKE
jgi:FkbM family methyltransferase